MKANTFTKLMISLSLLVLLSTNYVLAQQVTDATITERVGFWNDMDGGFNFGDGDDPWGEITMPFPFQYDGVTVNRVFVYGNGFLSFNIFREPSSFSVPDVAQYPYLVSWYGADLFTTGSLKFKTEGTAPFRVVVIEHSGARTFLDFSGATFDVQVRLYETTNNIEIMYGDNAGLGGQGINGSLFWSGSGGTNEYINVQPNQPTVASTFYYSNDNPNTTKWIDSDTRALFPDGKIYTYLPNPVLSDIYPDNETVLSRGEVYDGNNRPFVRINRAASQNDVAVRFKISGPLPEANPEYNTIYTAVAANDVDADELIPLDPQPVGEGVIFRMPHAKDIAGRLSDGALDLATNESQLIPGEYLVEATVETPDNPAYSQTVSAVMNIAFGNDIAIVDKILPVEQGVTSYPLQGASGVPVEVLVRNLGSTSIESFTVKATITRPNGSSFSLDDFVWVDANNPLEFGETERIVFSDFQPIEVGLHEIDFEVELNDAAEDNLLVNNVWPRDGEPEIVFEVAYESEGEITSLVNPEDVVYVGAPVNPGVLFTNNGIAEITETWTYMIITNPDGDVVYEDSVLIDQIPSANGFVNQQTIFFPTFFPTEVGSYQVDVNLDLLGDENDTNNDRTFTITVVGAMSGVYTINNMQPTAGTNFATFQEAVNALYLRGVGGDVEFRVFEGTYEVGSTENLGVPALDLSARIIGAEDHHVTFLPEPNISNSRSIKINLNSGNGIGVLFGTNATPNNVNAAVQRVNDAVKRQYASSYGNITFDGGSSNAFHFTLNTTAEFRAAFYLGEGANNIEIKNSFIDDANPSYACTLPLTTYNPNLNRYLYDANNSADGTYTGAIVSRNLPPIDPVVDGNVLRLDTLINGNNTFMGNNISGFGYGIVSLGLGSLRDSSNPSRSIRFYNTNNTISENTIHNVGKAGIFLGYEENATIANNRIYNIQNMCDGTAAGIMAGGMKRGIRFGYNNINLVISGNEISQISATDEVYAIKIVQSQNSVLLSNVFFRFPDINENSRIYNNVIWGIEGENVNTDIYGINLLTERETPGDNWDDMNNFPALDEYFTRNDWILNNTIVFLNDNQTNQGVYAPVAVYQSFDLQLWNNAIAILDEDLLETTDLQAAVLYYGAAPELGGIVSDRNAYYIPNENAALYRFIETDLSSDILEYGFRNEFMNLRQWTAWTGSSVNSITGDFVSDHEFIGINPQSLRIRQNPIPAFSILNNRAENIPFFDEDIDGELRGEAEERWDIGAVEFNGVTSDRDMEAIQILNPVTYKATPPMAFSDVEYFMTEAPVELSARVRNNSNITASGVVVNMNVYRQLPDGTFELGDTYSNVVNNLEPYENVDVAFTDLQTLFVPQTYADFRSGDIQPYNIPEEYRSMEPNVSPIYRFELELPADEINSNNKIVVDTRFYIMKSNVKLLISTDRLNNFDQDSHPQEIATNLNLDSLIEGFTRLGWIIDLGIENYITDIDIFDRKVWEPRSIDYSMYRSLFWNDGHNLKLDENGVEVVNTLTRYEKDNLNDFLNAGRIGNKKNLFVGSEEMPRILSTDDLSFLNNTLRSGYVLPGNPLGVDANYGGNTITGINLGNDLKFGVVETTYPNDPYPNVSTLSVFANQNTSGRSGVAFQYDAHFDDNPGEDDFAPLDQRIAGVFTATLQYNIVNIGIDWRHFADIERTLRALLDFAQKNDGNVVPVELLSFDATPVGERVDISWTTGSEENSSLFLVEKANVINDNYDAFLNIGSMDAAGRSTSIAHYGPIVDTDVQFGNTYAYRLKMVDVDGEFEYSEIKQVEIGGINGLAFSKVQPNPATEETEITYTTSQSVEVEARLVDISGRTVLTINEGMVQAGANTLKINVNNLTSGVYTLIINAGEDMITRTINVAK